MDIDKKEDILVNFSKGNIKHLITKSKITAFGLNWQHCNHTVFFPTWSYEQMYQSIRRFWRFGQTKNVTVDYVYSDGQSRVLQALELKTKKANELYEKLNRVINSKTIVREDKFNDDVRKPKFL